MSPYKRIERQIGEYIAARYHRVVEVGIGNAPEAARVIAAAGGVVTATDIRPSAADGIPVIRDNVFSPDDRLYRGADLLYAIRPGVEMVPPLVALARRVNADLLVYHLGNEIYGDGGTLVDCGVVLHRYHTAQKSED
ncbi:MAG: hypothetical protein LUO86_04900 [Methanomicrobiales archaeon]|nr:hypothetical protein [Methanomicrobiales archaeon]MDD1654856.1 hypothetical protein [Methanomicrobiales archaeon]